MTLEEERRQDRRDSILIASILPVMLMIPVILLLVARLLVGQ